MGGGRICSMWDAAGALRCIFSGSDLVTSAATHGGAHISTPSMSPTSPLCSLLLLHSAVLLLLLLCCSTLLCSYFLYCTVTPMICNMGWEHICAPSILYNTLICTSTYQQLSRGPTSDFPGSETWCSAEKINSQISLGSATLHWYVSIFLVAHCFYTGLICFHSFGCSFTRDTVEYLGLCSGICCVFELAGTFLSVLLWIQIGPHVYWRRLYFVPCCSFKRNHVCVLCPVGHLWDTWACHASHTAWELGSFPLECPFSLLTPLGNSI